MSTFYNYDKIVRDLYKKLEATMDRVTVLEGHMRSAAGKVARLEEQVAKGFNPFPDTAHECCSKCANRGNPTHGCPYQQDINGDDDFQCRCCAECTDDCRMAI